MESKVTLKKGNTLSLLLQCLPFVWERLDSIYSHKKSTTLRDVDTAYSATTERNPINSIDRTLPVLIELLYFFPNGAGFFYKNVALLFPQVSAAKRNTFFLFPLSAPAVLPSDLPTVYSDFDANFNTLLQNLAFM